MSAATALLAAALLTGAPLRTNVAIEDVPDEALVDQDGREVRLRSDLLQGKVVALNFVFTTCSTICSPMTAIFSSVQGRLGDRLGRDVRLVSITLDPLTDTPERLARYAAQFGRRAGWSFLTGPRERVVRVLKALGGYAPEKERHAPLTLVGDASLGAWVRLDGLVTPAMIEAEIDRMSRRPRPRAGKDPP